MTKQNFIFPSRVVRLYFCIVFSWLSMDRTTAETVKELNRSGGGGGGDKKRRKREKICLKDFKTSTLHRLKGR